MRVAVLVDLIWSEAAGGHVKFWERAAGGAAGLAGLDLTVFFAAAADGEHVLAPNVRYRLLRPVFGTQRLPFLSHVPDHTDLAPYHPRLARALAGHDVIHTTDAYFAYARTAERVARRRRLPLVNSVHTDTPGYTRLYTAETVRRRLGTGWLARLLLDRLHVDARAERGKLRRLARHQAMCRFVLGPRDDDLERARRVLPAERVLRLPRGLELDRFHPRWRDRAWLAAKLSISPETPVVLCVGRVNVGKNVMTLAEAVRQLVDGGETLVLVCAGEGEDRARVEALLGPHARCPGVVTGDDMARLYASADLLAHPSEIETYANVVTEGMAAGLPALVSARGTARERVSGGQSGAAAGVVVEGGASAWAAAIAALLRDPARRAALGRAARAETERVFTDWRAVVAEKLLPVWTAAARAR
ncbi:MAG: glycosyltransferase [Candidatus Odyssella sp.]|nr:glycosyltransferase [Candidatus Odyssella sp.]